MATRRMVAAVISHTVTEKHLKMSNESGICNEWEGESQFTVSD